MTENHGGEPRTAQARAVRSDTRGQKRPRPAAALIGLILVALCLAALWPARLADANHDSYCYVVGDNASNQRVLSRVDKSDFNASTNEVTIGVLGTLKTDGMAMHPVTGVLYGINTNMSTKVGVFGTISLSTGQFTAIGNGLGVGSGSLGEQELYDASGFAFDPSTGILYGTSVRTGSDNAVDLLYQVNLANGQHVPNAFGAGVDYVVMPRLAAFPQFHDIDDIAIDPATGQMYGILNNSTDGDLLITINKTTGATANVGAFDIGEVEGLDFDPHGNLWATAGGTSGTEANKLYQVNKNTGHASNPRPLDNAYDYEALACMTGAIVVSPTSTRTATPTRTATVGPPPTLDPSFDETVYLPLVRR